jgi:CRISPR-associated endoribonuclease Cas6
MPIKIGLELRPERPVILPLFTGHVARGLLLHIIRWVDPGASSALHELNVTKPYSVTPLEFKSKERTEKGYLVDVDFPCRVWFRFLRDELFNNIPKYFSEKDRILVYDTIFRIASLNVKFESYEDLLRGVDKPVRAFRIYFKTPTYLKTLGTDYHYMFPDHLLVFPNLMRLWNSFSDCRSFSKEEFLEYRGWLLKNVGVSQHEIRTRIAYMGRRKATGFTGWATYEMKTLDEWNRVTCALAKFAEYSNLGGNRTGGFGVVEYRSKQ